MNTKIKIMALCAGLLIAVLPLACKDKQENGDTPGEKKWNRSKAENEYELMQAEMRLIAAKKPYLVFDFPNKEILIKLKGTVVWNCPIQLIEADSEDTDGFARRFRGNFGNLIRPMLEKHLFAFSDKTPDSILAIVGEAVNVDPELLQREVPERFQLSWGKSLALEVRTNVAGKPLSRFKNTLLEFKRVIQSPFGESYLVVRMEPEMALTLYRVSQPGLATMVYPPAD